MKIMFVDDEQLILTGIKRALFRSKWEIILALSGQQALETLQETPVDVVVSDMLMPGMNGAELLETVGDLYPSIVRIILSGHADDELALRASYIAHQWLSKPCDPLILKEELTRIDELRLLLPIEKTQKVVGGIKFLPSPPRIYRELKTLFQKDRTSTKNISKIISRDPSITLKLLQLSNSAFFFRGEKITEIDKAISRLGVNVVCNIVLAAEVYSQTVNIEESVLDAIHHRSANVALLAQSFVEESLREQTMLAGLLHNLGEIMLYSVSPESTSKYLELRNNGGDNTNIERELFGADNIQFTSYFLHLWSFPCTLIECIALQNQVSKLVKLPYGSATAIYIANQLLSQNELNDDFITHFNLEDKLTTWKERASHYIKLAKCKPR
jgi:HD-like signal output (HDOD) protein/CheY-like chemotaxis protein